MLIRFVVSNYLSFGAETEFNMLTSSPRRMKEHIYHFGDLELLKTAAIYGPNGAGKSNLVKAMALLRKIVVKGQWDVVADVQPFRLHEAFRELPMNLEAEFVLSGESYSYGISILSNTIVEEWLYRTGFGKGDQLVFNRMAQHGRTRIEVADRYYETAEDQLRIKLYEEELLKDDQPLIKLMAEAKQVFEEVRAAFQWFRDHLVIIFPKSRPIGLVINYSRSGPFRSFTNDLLCSLQTGVSELGLETIDIDQYFGEDDSDKADKLRALFKGKEDLMVPITPDGAVAVREGERLVVKRLVTRHKNEEGALVDFSIDEESDGTQRILDLLPAFYKAIYTPATVVVDEIDQSIHPALLKDLVAKFVGDGQSQGQVLFTTHESHLLDQQIFRQDEIWFTEKKPSGETTLYPLSDYGVRFDLDIRKGYLNGRFGAIPFLANLQDLNWDVYAEAEPGI